MAMLSGNTTSTCLNISIAWGALFKFVRGPANIILWSSHEHSLSGLGRAETKAPLGGIIALSTAMFKQFGVTSVGKNTPMLFCHGDMDDRSYNLCLFPGSMRFKKCVPI